MVLNSIYTYDLTSLIGQDDNRIKTQTMNAYTVRRYDKKALSPETVSTYGLCRSVITDADNNIVAFSPPKSLPFDDFVAKYPDTSRIVATEFVEGTMINVFWSNGDWEIASRSNVGATNGFTKTFRDMFYDAMNACNLVLNTLPKEFSYSFVLQHPDNRIVVPIGKPQLYLIAVYSYHQGSIDNQGTVVKHRTIVKSHDLSDFPEFNATTVNVPAVYDLTTYEDFAEKTKTLDYTYLGVMLTNPATGERTKIRNPNYEKVRHLKGNHPKLQYQYLCLRKSGKISQYLHYYPESNKEFAGFRDKVHEFTRKLRDNYISCYIRKERPLMEYSDEYRTHMYSLHQIYKNNLKPNGKILVFEDVVNYVNELHPNLLMHSINYSTFGKGGAKSAFKKSTFEKGGAKSDTEVEATVSEATVSEATVSDEPSTEEAVSECV